MHQTGEMWLPMGSIPGVDKPPGALAIEARDRSIPLGQILADMGVVDAEVVNESSGDPQLEIRGSVLARANDLGARTIHVSLSHDAGIASAMVVLED